MTAIVLTPAQRSALRGLAHGLPVTVHIGQDGVSAAVIKEVDIALNTHGLLKVRVLVADREAREQMMATLSEALFCAPVQHIGRMLVLWRARPEDAVPAQAARAAASAARAGASAQVLPSGRRPAGAPAGRATGRRPAGAPAERATGRRASGAPAERATGRRPAAASDPLARAPGRRPVAAGKRGLARDPGASGFPARTPAGRPESWPDDAGSGGGERPRRGHGARPPERGGFVAERQEPPARESRRRNPDAPARGATAPGRRPGGEGGGEGFGRPQRAPGAGRGRAGAGSSAAAAGSGRSGPGAGSGRPGVGAARSRPGPGAASGRPAVGAARARPGASAASGRPAAGRPRPSGTGKPRGPRKPGRD